MEPFRLHVFVCTQPKPEGVTGCAGSGSGEVLAALEQEVQARGLGGDVQLTACGCMGLCEEGPVLVAYPEGVWYRRVRAADVPEIVERHLVGGQPVERLVWRDAEAMKAMAVEHGERVRAAQAAREKQGALPERLEQAIRSFMPSRCLLTALELDLFTAVGEGATAEEVGEKVKANGRATAMLLNALVALGLLAKSGEAYRNTVETARYFVDGSKDNHRRGLQHTANLWHRWSTLTEAVRTGTRVAVAGDRNPEWRKNFIAGMQRNAKDRAPLVVKRLGTAGVRRVLDLGGGSGVYSIAFAKASPEVQCEILDLPEVVPLTAEYVAKAGVAAQVHIRPGNMLESDLGTGYDIILLNAICHMFSEEQNRELFRRARKALLPGGRLVVQDFILNDGKTGPAQAALFSLNMLVGTEGGASYSGAEYVEWMRAAGFAAMRRIELPGPSDLMIGVAGTE